MKIKAIITGASGMVGEGVLYECLQHNDVEEISVIGRRSCGYTHPKLKEIVHANLYDLSLIEDKLKGYNACFFCLGTSSVGKKEAEFFKVTYELTMHFATTLSRLNPDMTFCYISGAGTDSTEKGRLMWARIKGKTENDLMKLPFRQIFNFRPGLIKPTKGLKNILPLYKWLSWMLPIINTLSPGSVVSLKQIGDAMINSALKGYGKNILEVKDIIALSKPDHNSKKTSPGETYDLKRQNFKNKTLEFFQFLVTDFKYEEPIYKFHQQENGTIISDSFFYINSKINRVIAVKNHYHPYDYGFSIEIGLLDNYVETNVGKLLLYKLKEEQDIEQSYIKELVEKFRNDFSLQINGSAI